MEKIDFKKTFGHLYKPSSKEPQIVDVPPMQVMFVEGCAPPASEEFQQAISALYGAAYTTKFDRKKRGIEPDFTIGALEGHYWSKTGKKPGEFGADDLCWRLFVWVPDFITAADLRQSLKLLKEKHDNPALDLVHLKRLHEGRSMQMMHVGPYQDETRTIETLMQFARDQKLRVHGMHHEIYISDPRRTAPERLKTILRYGIR